MATFSVILMSIGIVSFSFIDGIWWPSAIIAVGFGVWIASLPTGKETAARLHSTTWKSGWEQYFLKDRVGGRGDD